MGSMFSGRKGIGGLASPLTAKIDPVGNATSDALFGKMKDDQKRAATAATSDTGSDIYGADTYGKAVAMTGDGADVVTRNEKLKPISTSTLLGT